MRPLDETTAWRTLEAIDGETLAAIAQPRAVARATAWAAGADPGFYVTDFDGTLIGSHSEKEGAAPTYKRGFGFHPLLAILDGTGEALAAILRPGTPRPTPPPITSTCSTWRWPSCRSTRFTTGGSPASTWPGSPTASWMPAVRSTCGS